MSQQTISSPSLQTAVVRKEGAYQSFSGYGIVALIAVLFITGVLLVLSHTPVLAGAVTFLPWYVAWGSSCWRRCWRRASTCCSPMTA